MGRRLELETCFGVNYNQLLQGCQKCPDAVECVHLMRIRCAQLLEERKEEVERASRDSNLTKKERRRMARKRKKEEEEPKKKAGRPPAEKKELSEKAKKTRIKELKGQLEEARADKDKKAAGKIRAELRSLGHYLSQTGEDSRKGRKKDDDDEPKKLRGRKEKPEEEEEEEED